MPITSGAPANRVTRVLAWRLRSTLAAGLIISALIVGSGTAVSAQSGPIFTDPLADPSLSTSWSQGQGPDRNGVLATGVYRDDGYHLALDESSAYILFNAKLDGVLQAGGAGANQSIEVDATQVDGEVNNAYGVACRAGVDPSVAYLLWAGSDGTAGIYKLVSDGKPLVVLVHTTIPADTGYHLRGDCNGNRLALSVNGAKVAEAQDDDYKSGHVGLYVSTNEASGIDVAFTNLRISRP